MAHLGEFGRELAAIDSGEGGEPDVFTFHGVEFEVPAHLSVLPRMRFAHANLAVQDAAERADRLAAAATTGEERDEAALADAMGAQAYDVAVLRYIEDIISGEGALPDQWARFQEAAARSGADRSELVGVAHAVYGASAGRPRVRSSVSPSGPSTSGGGSTAGSDSTAGTSPAGAGGEPQENPTGWTPAQQQRAAIAQMMQPVAQAVSS